MIIMSEDKRGGIIVQEKLLLIRKNKNITQQELADCIGISVNQYSLKEKGKYNFNCDEMFKIADYLKMSIEEIFLPLEHQNGVNNKSEEV